MKQAEIAVRMDLGNIARLDRYAQQHETPREVAANALILFGLDYLTRLAQEPVPVVAAREEA